VLSVDRERVEYWRRRGAQLSETVESLLRKPDAPLGGRSGGGNTVEAPAEG
jgi:ribosomal protein S16